ncbi:GerW family sporulation protein [Haloferax sp. S1W]|uniref:GerW family sporulation protein n=1 Tax=Haloferax sp. S1W TaxID=3377110 RepID=UPI0037C75C58
MASEDEISSTVDVPPTETGAHEIDIETTDRELLSSLESITQTDARTVYGDPVTVGEKTVIPVARVAFGMGMGGGSGTDESGADGGEGFGGGGGAQATPLGVVEVTPDETTFIRFADRGRLARILAVGIAIGLLVGRFLRR